MADVNKGVDMESNCKIWVHGANCMIDGYINENCETFVLIPGHGGRSAMPIHASMCTTGYTIYPG